MPFERLGMLLRPLTLLTLCRCCFSGVGIADKVDGVAAAVHVRADSEAADLSTLQFVQVLFRHGDRNPNRPWGPDDPNPEFVWPQGWGQLTPLGKRQMWQLGKLLKSRYSGFMSDSYFNQEIYVRSTGRDRALMSAQCFLAGFYPPSKEEQFEASLTWQPVPIHAKGIDQDWIMRSTKVCPKTVDQYLNVFYEDSHDFRDYFEANKEFIERITKAANLFTEGNDVKNVKKMWKLGGNLHIVRLYNKTLLPWATDEIIDELIRLRSKKFEVQARATSDITRLSGGPLLGHLLNNFLDWETGKLRPEDHGQKESVESSPAQPRMLVFSGHDSNIAFLLAALHLFYPAFWPAYAATIFAELHRKGDGPPFVRLFFKNGIDAPLKELQLPGCATDCTLKDLVNKYHSAAVWNKNQFDTLCLYDLPETHMTQTVTVFTYILTCSAILFGCYLILTAKNKETFECEKEDTLSKDNLKEN